MNFLVALLVQHLATVFQKHSMLHLLHSLYFSFMFRLYTVSSASNSQALALCSNANSAFACLPHIWLHLFLVAIDKRCVWWRSFSKDIISLPSSHRVFDIGGGTGENNKLPTFFALIPSFAPTNTENSSVFVDTKGETPQNTGVFCGKSQWFWHQRFKVHAWDMPAVTELLFLDAPGHLSLPHATRLVLTRSTASCRLVPLPGTSNV